MRPKNKYTMSVITENELSKKCRICLEIKTDLTSFVEPVYIEDEDSLGNTNFRWYSLAEILHSISSIEVEIYNNLPEQVCADCVKKIVEFKHFITMLKRNQTYLHELINSWTKTEGNITIDYNSKIEICSTEKEQLEEVLITQDAELYESNSGFENVKNEYSTVLAENSLVKLITDKKTDSTMVCAKYSCQECGDCFLIKSGFALHMIQKHNKCVQVEEFENYSTPITIKMPHNYSGNVLKFVPKSQSTRKHINQFQCRICKSEFSTDTEFKTHREVHRIHKCPQCGAAFIKSSYLKDHLLMHSSVKMFGCEICGKTFKYRNGLSVHKMIHDNFRGHICDTCGQGFNAKSTLLTHIRLKHHGEKKYPCPDCQLSFKEKSWLNKHILRKHSGNRTKDFVCSMCGMAYLNKYTLDRHISDKHTGTPKRHYCTICDKSYTMKNKLSAHLEKKHFLAVNNDKSLTVL